MKAIRITQNLTSGLGSKTFVSTTTALLLLLVGLLLLAVRSSVFADSGGSKFGPTSSDRNAATRRTDASFGTATFTIPNSVARDPIFTDATAAARLDAKVSPFGNPIWGDFDDDGNLDVFVDSHYGRPYFYLNNGNETFTDIRSTSGLITPGDRHGSAWGDFDNDGQLDLFITQGAQGGHSLGEKKDELYLNLGDAQFTNIAEAAGVTNTWGRGRGVAWGDYDNDGHLDLLLGNLKTDMALLKNNGDGTFLDVTAAAGLGGLQYIECAFADYNNDGFPDIFCTIAEAHQGSIIDLLLKNNGDGTFTNVSNQAGILSLLNGRSIAWGDYNNDGYLDLFISRGTDNEPLKQTLYKNNGNGTFTEVTDESGLGNISNNRAAAWGDFNNDGFLDLYLVNSGSDPAGKGPNHLYRNNKNGTFADVASRAGVEDAVVSRGRGCAWGDYDNDGFLDLFLTNGEDGTDFVKGPQFLFHNGGNGNNWLKIKLVGTTSNRQGLGAKVTIQFSRTIEYREANGASGHFLSQGAGPVHFGIGKAPMVDQVTVQWPSGINQVLSNISPNQEITVTEGL